MLRKIFLLISVSLVLTTAIFAQGSSTTATTSTTASTKKPAVFRPTKDQIEQVQTMLKTKKLYDGAANGKYNDPTRAGIKSFQKDNGLKETGTLNRATLEKFGVELTDSQKLIPVSPGSFASDETKTTKSAKSTSSSTTTASTGDKTKKPAPFRANADQIKAAQKLLKEGKMYTGEETGKLDDGTRDGLKKYQEANGVKVTGTLNAATLEKMGIALTDAQKANAAATPTPKD
jgi:peptidoglycan hydrolase-like protein with peptidoglycan-binding domain